MRGDECQTPKRTSSRGLIVRVVIPMQETIQKSKELSIIMTLAIPTTVMISWLLAMM